MVQRLRPYNVLGTFLVRAEPLPPAQAFQAMMDRAHPEHLLPKPLTSKLTHRGPALEMNLMNSRTLSGENHGLSLKGTDRPWCLSRQTFQCIPSSKSPKGLYVEDRGTCLRWTLRPQYSADGPQERRRKGQRGRLGGPQFSQLHTWT